MKKIWLFMLLPVALFAQLKLYSDDITSNQAYKMQQEGIILIDVRTVKEFKALHPKGAINIPVYFEKEGQRVFNEGFVYEIEQKISYETPVVLICRTGSRTKEAANILAKKGFSEVYNVSNGFANDWMQVKLPVER